MYDNGYAYFIGVDEKEEDEPCLKDQDVFDLGGCCGVPDFLFMDIVMRPGKF